MASPTITIERATIDPFLAAQAGFDLLANLDDFEIKVGDQSDFAYYLIPDKILPNLPSIDLVKKELSFPDGPPNVVSCGAFFATGSSPDHIDHDDYFQVQAINCIGKGLLHGQGIEPVVLRAGDGFTVDNCDTQTPHGVDILSIPRVSLIFGWMKPWLYIS